MKYIDIVYGWIDAIYIYIGEGKVNLKWFLPIVAIEDIDIYIYIYIYRINLLIFFRY